MRFKAIKSHSAHGLWHTDKSLQELPTASPIKVIQTCRKGGNHVIPLQDRGHGKTTDRLAMTFFFARTRGRPCWRAYFAAPAFAVGSGDLPLPLGRSDLLLGEVFSSLSS